MPQTQQEQQAFKAEVQKMTVTIESLKTENPEIRPKLEQLAKSLATLQTQYDHLVQQSDK
jgi:hypothetical protein